MNWNQKNVIAVQQIQEQHLFENSSRDFLGPGFGASSSNGISSTYFTLNPKP